MSAKDKIHDTVKNALIKDGWIITADPLTLEYEDTRVFVDLAAERVIAAERQGQKIAVEVKSFLGRSIIYDVRVTLGQYLMYISFLKYTEPDRELHVAISHIAYRRIIQNKAAQMLIEDNKISLIVVDLTTQEVSKWIQN